MAGNEPRVSSEAANVSGAAPKNISVLTAKRVAQKLRPAACPQQLARPIRLLARSNGSSSCSSSPLSPLETITGPVAPTMSARSRTARRNGSIRPGVQSAIAEFRQEAASRQPLSLKSRRMTCSWVSFWSQPLRVWIPRSLHTFIRFLPQKQSDAKSRWRFWSVARACPTIALRRKHSRRWVNAYEVRNHAPDR